MFHTGTDVTRVVLGLGPSGELRYPSHLYSSWATLDQGSEACPGVGWLMTYSPAALKSWQVYKEAQGLDNIDPDVPDITMDYDGSGWPMDVPEFQQAMGEERGAHVLKWYSTSLLQYASRMIAIAKENHENQGANCALGIQVGDMCYEPIGLTGHTACPIMNLSNQYDPCVDTVDTMVVFG